MIRWLLDAFRSPSAFRGDPRGYLRNQVGHAVLVGWLPVAAFGPWALAVTLPAYLAWEYGQWVVAEAEAWDSAEDVAHVLAGATAALFWPVAAVSAAFLTAGYLRRREEARHAQDD